MRINCLTVLWAPLAIELVSLWQILDNEHISSLAIITMFHLISKTNSEALNFDWLHCKPGSNFSLINLINSLKLPPINFNCRNLLRLFCPRRLEKARHKKRKFDSNKDKFQAGCLLESDIQIDKLACRFAFFQNRFLPSDCFTLNTNKRTLQKSSDRIRYLYKSHQQCLTDTHRLKNSTCLFSRGMTPNGDNVL